MLSKIGTKMRKGQYKMGQDGAKMGVLGSTCDVLARSWPQFGRFWEVLGSILEAFWDIGGSVKTNDSTAFWKDFGMLKGLVGGSRSLTLLILMLSWAILGHLGDILRQQSDKMRQPWNQNETHDRQHVPEW